MVIAFANIFSLTISADHTSDDPSCLVDHFNKLSTTNIDGDIHNPVAPNMEGSCVFVAMSMLLSYYDVYWNDRFITGQNNDINSMDWSSGIYNSSLDKVSLTFNAEDENDKWNGYEGDAFDFALEHQNDYLQSYLLRISKQKNPLCGTGILDIQAKEILKIYLYDTCNFDET